jgi:hypothetical protein
VTIHFPDLSHYPDADPRKAGTQTLDLHDVEALITKATEGTGYVDPTYTTYRDRAHGKGIPFAAFHWLHASDIPGQARHAFSVVGRDIPLMIDDEDPTDGLSVDRTAAFVRAYRSLGGLITLEYLPPWFHRAHGSPSLRPLADLGLAFVSSYYTAYSDTGPGWASYGGITPDIWQHTSSAALDGAVKVDMNAYRGSIDELRGLFQHGSHTQEGTTIMGNANTEDLMNRTINGHRIADILGEEDAANDTVRATAALVAEVDDKVDAVLTAVKAIPGAASGDGTLSDGDVDRIAEAVAAKLSTAHIAF